MGLDSESQITMSQETRAVIAELRTGILLTKTNTQKATRYKCLIYLFSLKEALSQRRFECSIISSF